MKNYTKKELQSTVKGEGKSTYKYYKVPNEQLWAIQECNSVFEDGWGSTCVVIGTRKSEAQAIDYVKHLTKLQLEADSKYAKGTIDGGSYDIIGGARTVNELSLPELETQLKITKSNETERIKLIKKLIEQKSDKYAKGSTIKGADTISLYETFLDDKNREVSRILVQSVYSEERLKKMLQRAEKGTFEMFDKGRYDYKQEVFVHPRGVREPYLDKYKKTDWTIEGKYAKGSTVNKYKNGGGIGENKIDFKNFTIAEFNSFVKSINNYGDIQVSVSVGNNVNKEGTYTKKIDLKKLKDLSMSLGDGKEISVITGSENIYADVLVYDNNYDKGYKEYTISLFSKDDKKGLKSIVNAIIEKFKNGGGIDINELNMPVIRTQFEDEEYEFKDGGNVKVGDKVMLPEIKMRDGKIQFEKVENGEVLYIENGIYGVLNPKTKRIHQVSLNQIKFENGGTTKGFEYSIGGL